MIKVWIIGIVLGLIFLLIVRYILHFKNWVNSDVGYDYVKGKFSRALYIFTFLVFCIPCLGVVVAGVVWISLIVSFLMGDTSFRIETKNKTIQKIVDYLAEEV